MRRIKFLSAVVVAVSVLASGIATSADKGQPDIHQVLRDLEAKEQANVLLYKNFYYGQPRSDLLKIKGARDCSQSSGIERAVCIDKQRFAGSNGWTALFSFFNDRLHRVVLIAENPTGAAFNLATGALLKNDFIAVLIESGNHLFDIIRMSQVGTEKDGYRYYQSFMKRHENAADLKMTFVQKTWTNTPSAGSVDDLKLKISKATRFAILYRNNTDVLVAFTAPIMEEKEAKKLIESVPGDKF